MFYLNANDICASVNEYRQKAPLPTAVSEFFLDSLVKTGSIRSNLPASKRFIIKERVTDVFGKWRARRDSNPRPTGSESLNH